MIGVLRAYELGDFFEDHGRIDTAQSISMCIVTTETFPAYYRTMYFLITFHFTVVGASSGDRRVTNWARANKQPVVAMHRAGVKIYFLPDVGKKKCSFQD